MLMRLSCSSAPASMASRSSATISAIEQVAEDEAEGIAIGEAVVIQCALKTTTESVASPKTSSCEDMKSQHHGVALRIDNSFWVGRPHLEHIGSLSLGFIPYEGAVSLIEWRCCDSSMSHPVVSFSSHDIASKDLKRLVQSNSLDKVSASST
ncbi:hypothetical protein HG530_000334 [Fusarium avenaceum]|nr:hypothetical protein HG530_000334 [Fusarium avenaceum]